MRHWRKRCWSTPSRRYWTERQEDLAFFDQRIEKRLVAKLQGIVGSEFVHMDYGEAIHVLERANENLNSRSSGGIDLQSEHERYLTEKHAKKPVIVMNYPKAIKAFYMRVNDDGRTVAAMDVLAPGIGEIIGGSQREERLVTFIVHIFWDNLQTVCSSIHRIPSGGPT
jgi:asparaginyl-tRNA synthetase